MQYAAVRQYKDGGQAVMEYFHTLEGCLSWIARQPTDDSWEWTVGRFDCGGSETQQERGEG